MESIFLVKDVASSFIFNTTQHIKCILYLSHQGEREAAINVAEGKKQSQILASEARKMEQINIATGKKLYLLQ